MYIVSAPALQVRIMNFGRGAEKTQCFLPLAIKGHDCRFAKLFAVMGKDSDIFLRGDNRWLPDKSRTFCKYWRAALLASAFHIYFNTQTCLLIQNLAALTSNICSYLPKNGDILLFEVRLPRSLLLICFWFKLNQHCWVISFCQLAVWIGLFNATTNLGWISN